MKVQTVEKVILINDREGVLQEKIQIEITIDGKDDVNKIYKLKTVDNILYDNGSTSVFNNRYGQPQIKNYTKTYQEYDEQKALLLQMYPSELTGSELDDYLLQMGLLYNLSIDPIYTNQWEASV